MRAARDDHEIDRVHEVAHTRVGNQGRVDAESRQLVRNTHARGKKRHQSIPVSLETSRGNQHVETLVVLAVGKELVNDAGNAVRENGLHMREDSREHHSVANVQLPLVRNVRTTVQGKAREGLGARLHVLQAFIYVSVVHAARDVADEYFAAAGETHQTDGVLPAQIVLRVVQQLALRLVKQVVQLGYGCCVDCIHICG